MAVFIKDVQAMIGKRLSNGNDPVIINPFYRVIEIRVINGCFGQSVRIDHPGILTAQLTQTAKLPHGPLVGSYDYEIHERQILPGFMEILHQLSDYRRHEFCTINLLLTH